MHYWKTLFQSILIRNSSLQENAKTKVYVLDSLGVVLQFEKFYVHRHIIVSQM